jgi:hypothetical protein
MFPYLARPILLGRAGGIPTVEVGDHRSEISDIVDFRFKAAPQAVMGALWDAYKVLGPRKTRP